MGDVLDDPALIADLKRIDREYDLREYRYRLARGMVISKALWRRLKLG